jgi:release factor glutamine methyltransferase
MNEAELLFSHALGCSRMDLYLNKEKYLNQQEADFISSALSRRIKGEPIQYILGSTEFMGLEIKVDKNVLIPRPETEILAETAIEYAKKEKPGRVLDLGTGSGCIAIALAKHLAGLEIDASDISDKAMIVAKENARLNGARINFLKSDLFSNLEFRNYGMIISNPPYIPEDEIKKLQPELQFEPKTALNGGRDGLDFYRGIILGAAGYLKENGLLIMEIGFGQKEGLELIFEKAKLFKIIKIVKDYQQIERVIVARKAKING